MFVFIPKSCLVPCTQLPCVCNRTHWERPCPYHRPLPFLSESQDPPKQPSPLPHVIAHSPCISTGLQDQRPEPSGGDFSVTSAQGHRHRRRQRDLEDTALFFVFTRNTAVLFPRLPRSTLAFWLVVVLSVPQGTPTLLGLGFSWVNREASYETQANWTGPGQVP